MKNLKKELLKLAENWNASGEYDNTEFEGRYFINDDDLDEFASEHNLCSSEDRAFKDDSDIFNQEKIEKTCDCKIVYDYEGANQNRQSGGQEIIFNKNVKPPYLF